MKRRPRLDPAQEEYEWWRGWEMAILRPLYWFSAAIFALLFAWHCWRRFL